jgi:hypothetical protein
MKPGFITFTHKRKNRKQQSIKWHHTTSQNKVGEEGGVVTEGTAFWDAKGFKLVNVSATSRNHQCCLIQKVHHAF